MIAPRVLITDTVFKAMVNEVLKHPTIETSWGLAGLVFQKRNVMITNIILPAPEDIVRRAGTVRIGGDYQAEQLDWLARDHLKMKLMAKRPQVEGRELPEYRYVFSGHSHHTLGLKSYSGVDNRSIRLAIVENGLDVAIGPLANIVRDSFSQSGGPFSDPVMSISQGVEMRFYYLSKEMVERGITHPVKIKPSIVVERKSSALIPRLAWRYENREFFLSELRQLQALGANVQVMNRDLPQFDHLAVQFLLTKEGWKSPLLINTQWSYPNKKPEFEIMVNGLKTLAPIFVGKLKRKPVWSDGSSLASSVALMEEEGIL